MLPNGRIFTTWTNFYYIVTLCWLCYPLTGSERIRKIRVSEDVQPLRSNLGGCFGGPALVHPRTPSTMMAPRAPRCSAVLKVVVFPTRFLHCPEKSSVFVPPAPPFKAGCGARAPIPSRMSDVRLSLNGGAGVTASVPSSLRKKNENLVEQVPNVSWCRKCAYLKQKTGRMCAQMLALIREGFYYV